MVLSGPSLTRGPDAKKKKKIPSALKVINIKFALEDGNLHRNP
jgi:hypothetical protein